MTTLTRAEDGIALLRSLGATPWLVRHHELVVEAAVLVCDGAAKKLGVVFDRQSVLLGAALHDAGKIVHPEEMAASGSQHEPAGRALLLEVGVPATIARFCVTHVAWDGPGCTLEDALVALADKLWKGKRDEALEQFLVGRIAAASGTQAWEVFTRFDALCEKVAAGGEDRLARSNV